MPISTVTPASAWQVEFWVQTAQDWAVLRASWPLDDRFGAELAADDLRQAGFEVRVTSDATY